MTIASVRIYFYPAGESRELMLTSQYWGFAEWFIRRLMPIRPMLKGPEVKGVNIMNLMLYENPDHAWRANTWAQRMNSLEFSYVCDLSPLESGDPMENLAKLMSFYSKIASQAPWPQARAVATALAAPLSEVDRITLRPFMQWPRGEIISEAKAARILHSAAQINMPSTTPKNAG
jgi:hypothetical protein